MFVIALYYNILIIAVPAPTPSTESQAKKGRTTRAEQNVEAVSIILIQGGHKLIRLPHK